jgi:hypothetical protein
MVSKVTVIPFLLLLFYFILKDFESLLPKPASFEESGTEVPFVILGDEAYRLKTYLMKPFARKDLSSGERVFNYRLSRAEGVL